MQWILQEFEDTKKLAVALDRLQIAYSWHKVVPFVGDLVPEPVVADPKNVVLFGSYALWRNAETNGYWPGVFKLRPFVNEKPWQAYLLNGPNALFLTVQELPEHFNSDDEFWFLRPVDDSKAHPGRVESGRQIVELAHSVLSLEPEEIPQGSLRHDTLLMFSRPAHIFKEWRIWIVNRQIATYSLYKEGSRIVYRHEIDEDVLTFSKLLIDLNPDYAPAYVLDICRTSDGLKLLETNCLNAAGFYAADLMKLAAAIDEMQPT